MANNAQKPLRITMIGSGNVATHLSIAFENAGHAITMVYSRQKQNAEDLTANLKNSIPSNSLDFQAQVKSDIYIISVSDSAVSGLMQQAKFPPNSLVVHTSGSLSLEVLATDQQITYGVFYPLQTFSKNQPVNLSYTPIVLEATSQIDLNLLQALGQSISSQVFVLSGQDRKILHLAAVFACNFTNHLLGISHELLAQQGLAPTLLNSLIESTVYKALNNNPFEVQTGPAARGDLNILKAQQQLLSYQPEYQKIYRLLSESILLKSSSK